MSHPAHCRPSVTVCIATCRRPDQLRQTLLSLGGQRFNSVAPHLRVLVGENDEGQAGQRVASSMASQLPFPLTTLFESNPGISFVRNRLVAAVQDEYLAFIDDDEVAEPQWLDALLSMAEQTGAAAVLGPVRSRFEVEPPPWLRPVMADHGQHPDGAAVPDGYFSTCNLLLRREALQDIEGPFDPAFALTGGSDYMLGQELARRGRHAVWAARAVAHETIPAERASLRWYLRRRYRNGMVYSMAQQRLRGRLLGSLRSGYRGLGSLAVGGLQTARALPRRSARLTRSVGLLAYGLGNLAAVAGGRYEEYRRAAGT